MAEKKANPNTAETIEAPKVQPIFRPMVMLVQAMMLPTRQPIITARGVS